MSNRFHLVSGVNDRVPKLATRAAYAKRAVRGTRIEHEAWACHEAGALWNTFVLVARATTLAALGREALPELGARLERLGAFAGTPEETWATRQAFELARHANFSREVLERAPDRLAVSELPAGVRWTDWGTPERVIATLRRLGLRPGWLEALPRHLDLRSDARAVAALRRETSNGR